VEGSGQQWDYAKLWQEDQAVVFSQLLHHLAIREAADDNAGQQLYMLD
jgi:hypothetical protein